MGHFCRRFCSGRFGCYAVPGGAGGGQLRADDNGRPLTRCVLREAMQTGTVSDVILAKLCSRNNHHQPNRWPKCITWWTWAGCTVALHAAAQTSTKQVVLLSGVGVSPGETVRQQLLFQLPLVEVSVRVLASLAGSLLRGCGKFLGLRA